LCYERHRSMSARGLLCCLRVEEDQSGRPLLRIPEWCKKLIVNMVDSDHGMCDTVVRVSGSWEAESEECRAIPTIWNLGPLTQEGATLSADIEAKLQRLTVVNYDHRN